MIPTIKPVNTSPTSHSFLLVCLFVWWQCLRSTLSADFKCMTQNCYLWSPCCALDSQNGRSFLGKHHSGLRHRPCCEGDAVVREKRTVGVQDNLKKQRTKMGLWVALWSINVWKGGMGHHSKHISQEIVNNKKWPITECLSFGRLLTAINHLHT